MLTLGGSTSAMSPESIGRWERIDATSALPASSSTAALIAHELRGSPVDLTDDELDKPANDPPKLTSFDPPGPGSATRHIGPRRRLRPRTAVLIKFRTSSATQRVLVWAAAVENRPIATGWGGRPPERGPLEQRDSTCPTAS